MGPSEDHRGRMCRWHGGPRRGRLLIDGRPEHPTPGPGSPPMSKTEANLQEAFAVDWAFAAEIDAQATAA